MPNLVCLDLSMNYLTSEDAIALSNGKWPLLSSLILRENRIGTEGANALAKASWPLL